MPEPFKNNFNKTLIANMGGHFAKAYPEFDKAAFIAKATNNLDGLKLKERSDQISAVMANFLPNDFARAAEIMLASLAPEESAIGGADMNNRGVAGWAIMPMTHYVGLHGLGHFDLSMNLFKEADEHDTHQDTTANNH